MELQVRVKLNSISCNLGGYEYHFVRKNIQKYKCSICNKVCRDPHLTECCGQNFCWFCLNNWLQKQKKPLSCPSCRDEMFHHIRDVKLKSKIDSLKVKCPHWKDGCKCEVELGSLKDHLDSKSDEGCGYVMVDCPQKCSIKRKDLQSHIRDKCPHRPFECVHCGYKDTYLSITFSHYETCSEMPQTCPNKCGEENIKRKDSNDHLSSCPLEVVECPWGCKIKILRSEVSDHMRNKAEEHLQITQKAFEDIERRKKAVTMHIDTLLKQCEVSQRLQLESIRSILDDSLHLRNEEAEIILNATGSDDFEFMYRLGSTRIYKFCTPPFYFMEGYKFRIRIMIQRLYKENSTNQRVEEHTIEISLYLMKGEFDDDLVWPLNYCGLSLRIKFYVDYTVNGESSRDLVCNDTPSPSSDSSEIEIIPICSTCCRETLDRVADDTHNLKIGYTKNECSSEAARIAIEKKFVVINVAVSQCQHKRNIKRRRVLKLT